MPYSLYFHVPFCKHRCAYCDFNTCAGQEEMIPAYVEALCREIEFVGSRLPSPFRSPTGVLREGAGGEVHTIFFGGGTPSLLSARQFEKILRTISDLFDLSDLETSLEANPGTVSLNYLRDLRSLGFNRISFGVQSFHADELRQLERIHDPFDVLDAVDWARRSGFDNLNLDLIFGLPEQSLDRWSATVRRAVDLAPEHLSLYALTVEHGTPFGRWAERGLLPVPDADAAAEMYEWAGGFLSASGYEQYEISNWAKPGFQCKHNLQTWRNRPYLGFGAGAHGYAAGVRYSNVLRIKTYIERLHPDRLIPNYLIPNSSFPRSPATCNLQPVNLRTQMQETMMLGLRLTREGVSASDFRERFGRGLMDVFGREIDELLGLGLLEWAKSKTSEVSETSEVLRLTKRARLLGNQVFLRFVD
jgi:oxygen-independent coproporphyrinogen-3 oxidase